MPTIGEKLKDTRLSLGIEIERAAHCTHIQPSVLHRIEADDFSHFPSVAYARSFVRNYGEYLGLNLEDALEGLEGELDFQKAERVFGEIRRPFHKRLWRRLPKLHRRPRRRKKKKASSWFLNLVLVCLLAAIGIFYFLGYDAPTLEQAKDEMAKGLGLPAFPEMMSHEAYPLKEKVAPSDGVSSPAPESVVTKKILPQSDSLRELEQEEISRKMLSEQDIPDALRPREGIIIPFGGEELSLPSIPNPRFQGDEILKPMEVEPVAEIPVKDAEGRQNAPVIPRTVGEISQPAIIRAVPVENSDE